MDRTSSEWSVIADTDCATARICATALTGSLLRVLEPGDAQLSTTSPLAPATLHRPPGRRLHTDMPTTRKSACGVAATTAPAAAQRAVHGARAHAAARSRASMAPHPTNPAPSQPSAATAAPAGALEQARLQNLPGSNACCCGRAAPTVVVAELGRILAGGAHATAAATATAARLCLGHGGAGHGRCVRRLG